MKTQDKPTAQAILRSTLKLAKIGTMRSIYERIAPASDGAVHSFMNPASVETTRFSHSGTWLFDPGSTNLANVPKRTAMDDPLFRVRDCLVPHKGRLLGAVDYSQAEARWCAYMAQDPIRMRIYEENIDHYKYFVALLKWEDESRWQEVSKEERNSIGKVGVLSGQYQVGWKTLMHNVNKDFEMHGVSINPKIAKRMEALWPERFGRTVAWWGEVESQVLTQGYTVNPFGRKRIYFGRRDSPSARRAVVREAIADGPQSANAMAVNKALRTLYERYDPGLLRVLLQVHDEILLDFKARDLHKVVKVVKSIMEQPFQVQGGSLVIPCEFKATSKSWGEMKTV